MENQKKIPKRRFKGYDTEWEERGFDEAFDGLQNNTLSRADLNYDSGEVKNVHYGDVLVSLGEYIDISTELLPFINNINIAQKYSTSYLRNGDIVIADTAEDETVGKCTEILGVTDDKVLAGLHTIPCRPKQEYAPKYLGYYMNAMSYHKQLLPLMQGIKVTSISKGALKETRLLYPDKLEEQTQIGKFLSYVDLIIKKQQQKVAKLQNLKKAYLSEMFPLPGENKPRRRFRGFTGDWVQRKLGDVATLNGRIGFRGYTQKDIISKSEGGYLTFSPTNIVDNQLVIGEEKKNTYITRIKFDESPEIKVSNGDILFVKTGSTLGKSALVAELDEPASINPQIVIIRTEDALKKLLAYELTAESVIKQVAGYRIGGAVPTMTESAIKNFDIAIPTDENEQRKVGDVFSSLDNLIALHQRKLAKLQALKKAYLTEMFP